MLTLTKTKTGYTGRVILSDGTIAGEGYAEYMHNALYWACVDARDNGHDAGKFWLRTTDEQRVEAAVLEN